MGGADVSPSPAGPLSHARERGRRPATSPRSVGPAQFPARRWRAKFITGVVLSVDGRQGAWIG